MGKVNVLKRGKIITKPKKMEKATTKVLKRYSKYEKNFKVLFSQVSKCKNNTFLYFDDSDKYKIIQVEDWYRDNINNTFGIWLGEGIDTQVSLGVMSLTMEDKKTVFPCIGYPIYQGNHMVIKYVVDGVDKKDEE